MRIRVAAFLAAVIGALVPALPAAAVTAAGPTEWIVTFRVDATAAERTEAIAHATVLEGQAGGDFVLVEAAAAPSHPAIARAERPQTLQLDATAQATPNDPAYSYQWHLPAVQAPEAWSVTTGTGVTVAVLDTGAAYEDSGVYRRAPDLAGTTFAPGWDFVNGDSHPNDDHGHGTHVTGTIAQTTNNGVGVAGVAPGARIMPIKVLDASGNGTDWDIAKGLRWAADNGARVANLSIGGSGSSTVLSDAVAYATAKGVTIVASTGNDSGPVSYPAAYPDVLAVGAVRVDGTRPGYANSGTGLDVVAPGGDLSVDQNRDGYPDGILQQTFLDGVPDKWCLCYYQGTSMAAPHVSAIAALIVAQGSVTAPADVRAAIVGSALDLGASGWDGDTGFGLVQAHAALLAAGASAPAPTGPTTETVDDGLDAFSDDDGNAHEASINQLAEAGVVSGIAPGLYGPGRDVTRAQMATFLTRMLKARGVTLAASPPDAFADDEGNPHELAIDQLAAMGVVSGIAPGSYGPSRTVTRAQMATFLVRAVEAASGSPPAPAATDYFTDDSGNAHEAAINVAAELGLASGTGTGTYSPARTVRRDQMASFLARTLDLLSA